MKIATHNPDVFAVPDIAAAKRIIVTPTEGLDTDERWAVETPYLAAMARQELGLDDGCLAVDYGCGIGRISKALIETVGCRVIGVDSSAAMRALAPTYLPSPAFSVVSRGVLQASVLAGLQADAALAIWVLQHSADVELDIGLLRQSVRAGGRLFLVNMIDRAIPTKEYGWASDGKDVRALLRNAFRELKGGELDPAKVGSATAKGAYWAVYS